MQARCWPWVSINGASGEGIGDYRVSMGKEVQVSIRYRVELSIADRGEVQELLKGDRYPARKLRREQILLAADGGMAEEQTACNVAVSFCTVHRTRQRFVEGNLE